MLTFRRSSHKDNALTKAIESLRDKRSTFGFDISGIALESCGIDDVNRMIMRMMDANDEFHTRHLAAVCLSND